jgi:hypothetical protein
MLILLYIFLGLLIFDLLIACCIYFQKERHFKQYENQLKDLKTEKSTQYGKTAKGDRSLGVFSPIINAFSFRLK